MAIKKRLIDAEIVQRKINAFAASVVYRGSAEMFNGSETCNPYEYTRGYERGILDAQKIVCGQSTVDAVEVVRCKDCKNGRQPWLEGQTMVKCMVGKTMLVTPEHFCSYGERRTEDG